MTTSLKEYDIVSEPRGPSYEALLTYCAEAGAWCSLVERAGRRPHVRQFLESARPYGLGVERVNAWPGTGPIKGEVALWKFNLCAGLIQLLLSSSRGLYGWREPKLPEDLAFYRSDGSVLLGSVAHEYMAWMNLSPDEMSDRRLGLVELSPSKG